MTEVHFFLCLSFLCVSLPALERGGRGRGKEEWWEGERGKKKGRITRMNKTTSCVEWEGMR